MLPPDLASTDFHLFPSLEHFICGVTFRNKEVGQIFQTVSDKKKIHILLKLELEICFAFQRQFLKMKLITFFMNKSSSSLPNVCFYIPSVKS